MTLTDTGAHSRGFKGAHTHTRGTTVHQRSLRRRDGVARFIKAQQQAAVRPVDSLGTPRGSHSHLQTPPILRPQDKDVAIGDGRPKGHSGACEPADADSSRKRAPMGLPRHHPHHQHHYHQQHQGDNRLGGGEPLTQFHSTLLGTPTDASRRQQTRRHQGDNRLGDIKATTDSAAGSHLPSFIQLYWAPQQTRHGWWHGEE